MNKGRLVGQKAPLKLRDIWAIRIRLQISARARDLALFNLAIDSKLRACDLVKLRVCDVSHNGRVAARAIIMQRKTHRPVQFEITEVTRDATAARFSRADLRAADFPLSDSHEVAQPATSVSPAFHGRQTSSHHRGGANRRPRIESESSAD